ncbi:hypothetical protein [Bradyrhizobium sp. 157]|uniref:hypothetical protein n=1 Tax=Bradyrhizobium sp. 157 TaxID=2782631 RepID=UPI001FF917BB|nr:hypothetical protein [Bradyrhizobium sp. 157]
MDVSVEHSKELAGAGFAIRKIGFADLLRFCQNPPTHSAQVFLLYHRQTTTAVLKRWASGERQVTLRPK